MITFISYIDFGILLLWAYLLNELLWVTQYENVDINPFLKLHDCFRMSSLT